MPLPIFEKQDDIPEAFKSEYEEREGKWHPRVPDVTKLESALEKERTDRADEEKKRKAAEKERDELKRKQSAQQAGITDEQLQQLRAEDAEKRKPLEDENAELKAENRKLKLTDRVRTQALESGIMSDRIEDAMLVLERRTDLTSDSDSIVVLDKDGKPTSEKLEDFLTVTFKKEKPWLYTGSQSSGGGSNNPPRSTAGNGERPKANQGNPDHASTARGAF